MARASTTLAHAPTACTPRQPIIAQTLPASAQPAEPITKKGKSNCHWQSATEPVANRPPEQLTQAETDR
jgi:hypothetical protein